jgi:hypothetical protein
MPAHARILFVEELEDQRRLARGGGSANEHVRVRRRVRCRDSRHTLGPVCGDEKEKKRNNKKTSNMSKGGKAGANGSLRRTSVRPAREKKKKKQKKKQPKNKNKKKTENRPQINCLLSHHATLQSRLRHPPPRSWTQSARDLPEPSSPATTHRLRAGRPTSKQKKDRGSKKKKKNRRANWQTKTKKSKTTVFFFFFFFDFFFFRCVWSLFLSHVCSFFRPCRVTIRGARVCSAAGRAPPHRGGGRPAGPRSLSVGRRGPCDGKRVGNLKNHNGQQFNGHLC